jgi:predicted glycogen debranching enzyme
MGYIKFDKSKLINLEYSLSKEVLRANGAGSYANTTIIDCNTRKYHGLLICPLKYFKGEKFVLLSCLDVSVIQHEKIFNLGIHKYEGEYYDPKGHKYISDFETEWIPRTTYHVGGVMLVKESLLVEQEDLYLSRYTLVDCNSPTILRFRPFLAYRNMHELTHANMYANTKIEAVPHGIKLCLYPGFPFLHLQVSKKPEFIHVPDWYYNIEYVREKERGYDCHEDLFVPGYFEVPLRKGESLVFSASLAEEQPAQLVEKFIAETEKRIPRTSFHNCLLGAARQFIVRREGHTEVIAGFPWFGTWGRDTFISLPGLTLAVDDPATCKAVLDTMITKLDQGLFPNMGNDEEVAYNSVDAPLWFFWALQQYTIYQGNESAVWKEYKASIVSILRSFRDGTLYDIGMYDNGMIYAGIEGKALTWMDAVVHGVPVTPRKGFPVEINALWYNALRYSLQLAEKCDDLEFMEEWEQLAPLVGKGFIDTFWDEGKGYLADVVEDGVADWSVRPNQVIAAALDYSPLTVEMKRSVLSVVEKELLTPKGLRTLSPKNRAYKGIYEGSQAERDSAYHQGTVWPWLLEHYCKALLDVMKRNGLARVKSIYHGFEDDMNQYGIGTIPEIYDGDPPHHPKGAISQAWSVAAILRIGKMLETFDSII